MLWLLLIILVIILAAGALLAFPYSREWGYGPVGVLGPSC